MTREERKKAIVRRRIFLSVCALILVLVIALISFAVKAFINTGKGSDNSSKNDKSSQFSSADVSQNASSNDTPSYPSVGPEGLDANFKILTLVNGAHPLAEDYDYEANLTEIPASYINGSLNQIDKNVWPYMKAMIDAARADGVNLAVWSPYRSYQTQKMLFDKQVQRCINNGTAAGKAAEDEAATVVARPGTSEHHTGLAADFNMADDKFEQTPMYAWLQSHAADYGFIMRYSGEKQDKTGVIHESWHYRFVGINTAKEMNRLNMCLEEYTEYLNKQ